jgi:hypothetical protein
VTSPRRVLFLHEYPGGFGGAERYLELLAGGLVARGIGVDVVVWAEAPAEQQPVRPIAPGVQQVM